MRRVVILLALLAACDKPPAAAPPVKPAKAPSPSAPEAPLGPEAIPTKDAPGTADLPGVPRYPNSVIALASGGRDSAVVYYYVKAKADEVGEWFEKKLGATKADGVLKATSGDDEVRITLKASPSGYAAGALQIVVEKKTVDKTAKALESALAALSDALGRCRSSSSKTGHVHFLKPGTLEIFADADDDKALTDKDSRSGDAAGPGDGIVVEGPEWMAVHPTGSVTLPPGTDAVERDEFESAIAAGKPVGDIVLKRRDGERRLYVDIDPAAGKIRKSHAWTNRP